MRRPACLRLAPVSLALAVALLLVGCSQEAGEAPAPRSSDSTPTAEETDKPEETDGISAEEAEQADVLFARFDARLTEDTLRNGEGRVRLTNAGKAADTYRIRILSGASELLTEPKVRLAPGDSAWIELRTTLDSVSVEVLSKGRGNLAVAHIMLEADSLLESDD
jgi:hypothetical protein